MEWDDEKVIKLIELYRSKQLLWNPQHSNYKSRPKRYDAFNEIATELSTDLLEVERKIKNITSHYYRERKKMDRINESGTGTDEIYRSKWFAYKSLNFLRNKNMPTGTTDTATPPPPPLPSERSDSQSKQNDLPEISEDNTTPQPNKRPKYNPKHEIMSQALSIMKNIAKRQNVAKEKDEDGLFGDYIAAQLRKMDRSTKAFVRHRINNIIFKAERADMCPDFPRPSGSCSNPGYKTPTIEQTDTQLDTEPQTVLKETFDGDTALNPSSHDENIVKSFDNTN